MTLVMLPDFIGSVLVHLRENADLMTFVGGRISGALDDTWPMPKSAIVVTLAGGPQPDSDAQFQNTRLDFNCYGKTGYEAMRTWRVLHPILCPGPRGVTGWIGTGCRIDDVRQETGPYPLPDPDTSWERVWCPYIFRWAELPV